MTALRLAPVAAALVLLACPPSKPPVDAGVNMPVVMACADRADCEGGLICGDDKRCGKCTSSGQCTLKEVCQADGGVCALRAGWGNTCATNDACTAGSWCKQGLCVPRSDVSLCTQGLNSECPQGERCNKVTTVCEEDLGCSTTADCSAGETCNTGSRQCVPRCTVDTQAQVCAAGERCVGELCAQCASNVECGIGLVCDAAGRCTAGERCYTDRDCRVPLVCFLATGACLMKQPPCVSDDNCPANERCDVRAGRCVSRTCQPDRYEPNNEAMRAFTVTSGSYRDLTLCMGDVDWYGITLARGDQLGVNVDADPFSELNFSTVIKDAMGRTVAAGRLLVSYVAPTAGRYTVVISSIDPFQTYDVTYLLSRGTPCDDDVLEPNDVPTQPTMLNAQPSADGQICPQDVDWFRVQTSTGRGLTASLTNYDSGRGLLEVCVYTADGMSEVQCSDALNPVVTLPAALAAGQAFLIRVAGSTERVANAYTVSVEFP